MEERLKKLPIKIAVRTIITNDEQKVMLIKRASETFEGGKWCLIGGKQDEGESLETAVIRETKEEVGKQFSLVYHAEIENPDTSTGVRWITHYFVGNSNELPNKLNPREVSEIAFFSREELEKLDLAFDHKDILTQFYLDKH